jgi:hypothetical protein
MAVTKEIVADSSLVAFCGLYCGACGSYLKGRCPGCQKNEKASWCKVRTCCLKQEFASCADCKENKDPMECRNFNNFISKLFALVFRSDRAACIGRIRKLGIKEYAAEMASSRQMTKKRG